MFFFRVYKYLKYTLLARHRYGHGIHSPFVFDIVTRIFRNKTAPDIVCNIEKLRKRLMRDKRIVDVVDFGTGASKDITNKRKVSQIAKNSAVPSKYGYFLSVMASEFGAGGIIEFGTSLGISTMYLVSGSPNSTVFTMEGAESLASIARENFSSTGITNFEVIVGEFDRVLPGVLEKCPSPGLVFIDGNHRKEPLLRYFSKIIESAGSKTVLIIDDINYSNEMQQTWNELKKSDAVSVTIDINRMGIIFLQKGITPNHYVIRY